MSDSVDPQAGTPFRVLVAGTGRGARFHAERLGLRDDCRVVGELGTADLAATRDAARTLGGDVVLLDIPREQRAEWTIALLNDGRHVAAELPLTADAGELADVAATAQRSGRHVHALTPWRGDGEFRTVQAVLRDGVCGDVQTLHCLERCFAPPLPGAAPPACDLWDEVGPAWLDQLLVLLGDPDFERIELRQSQSPWAARRDGFTLNGRTTAGISVSLEAGTGSPAPLATGWIVNGTRGGFAGGRLYRPNAQGELVDTPAIILPTLQDDCYAALVAALRAPSNWPAAWEQMERWVRVWRGLSPSP